MIPVFFVHGCALQVCQRIVRVQFMIETRQRGLERVFAWCIFKSPLDRQP